MKIVHLMTSQEGGAARAAQRINLALNRAGVESIIIYKNQVYNMWRQFPCRVLNSLLYRISQFRYVSRDGCTENYTGVYPEFIKEIREADIIHFHWVASGFVGRNTIKSLKKMHKPIVWTLHDMRPFTGLCHYAGECMKYIDGCRECQLFRFPKGKIAYDDQKFNAKMFKKMNIVAVGCSKWITECAKKSFSMKHIKCINIPNCIDTKIFRPIDRKKSLKKMGLERISEKKILLYGAVYATSNPRKGYKYLKKLLNSLDGFRYACIVFGGTMEKTGDIEIISVGDICDDRKLVDVYNCADVFIAPSIEENLANTVMESLACNVPVVAFNIGGMPDMIEHKVNGYLAKPFDVADLKTGVEYCTSKDLKEQARRSVISKYGQEKIAQQYIDIYQSMLAERT